jgi:cell division protease FtsH
MPEELNDDDPFLIAPDESEEDEEPDISKWRARRHKKLQGKNQLNIDKFLGKGSRHYATGIMPGYYGELLIWALLQYLDRAGWKIAETLGYREPEPVYADLNTGSEILSILMSGQILVEKGKARYTITADVNPILRGSVQLEGSVEKKEEMSKFIADVLTIAESENFYRGKKLEFTGRIHFLDVKDKTWDTIVLDDKIKAEIKANSVGFLKQSKRWMQYGIPIKRGILLCGEPGTGKTVICKALMSEAGNITCIITNAYALAEQGYITELYELADDLSPSIVFIEDIDLIGQSRTESGFHHGPALIDLLAELDGIEEQERIITIATTNLLETLDRALSQRPSRFDKVIKLARPSIQQRRELISLLCRKIPMNKNTQEYIAIKAENCTPAQLQELVFGLTIQQPEERAELVFGKADIDRAISGIHGINRHQIGFVIDDNHNGHKLEHLADIGG